MNADTNAALIGLGYTKTKGGKLQLKAVVVSKDDEFVVNELDLPITVRNSDEYRAAKTKLKSEYQSRNQTKPTAQSAKELVGTSEQLEQAAKSKGLTKAEYKKQLEAAGYIVKEK